MSAVSEEALLEEPLYNDLTKDENAAEVAGK